MLFYSINIKLVKKSGNSERILTEVTWNFIAEDASGAVDLPDNVGKFRAGEHHLFGFLAD